MKAETKRRAAQIIVGVLILLAGFAAGLIVRGNGAPPGNALPAAAASARKTTVWTCSMHPQIRLPKAGKCPICFMDLIPLETGSEDEGGLRELTVSSNAAALMEIETAPVERRFVTATIRMVGKVAYDETRVSDITAWVPGRLDRLFVDYTGVAVQQGHHMVSLFSPELLSAQEELLQAIQAAEELKRSDLTVVRRTTEATVQAAREKLRLWGLTPDQIRTIESRGTADDHITIYAPVGGIVIDKHAQEGMYVKTGTRIYTIADLSQVWVNLDAYESDLAWLRYGQPVEFTAEAYPGEVFSGTIVFIQPFLDEATRTVKVRLNVPNEDGHLKPGMFVRAMARANVASGGRVMDAALLGKWICPMHPEVVKDQPGTCDVCGMPLVRAESLGYVGAEPTDEDKPLAIPASAPLLTGKRAIVYVQVPGKEKPTYEGREIVLGPQAGDYYLVKRGLTEGERVVMQGAFKLDAELQIRAKPSMMTPAGGAGSSAHAHHGAAMQTGQTDSTAAPAMTLPAVVQSQLQDVVAAGMHAVKASADADLERIRSSYAALEDSVAVIDPQRLTGDAAMLWKEYAMLLSDDGAVGAALESREEAVRLAETVGEHLEAVQSKLGIVAKGHVMAEAEPIAPAFRGQLGAVVEAYLAIQMALAGDDREATTAAADQALEALATVDMELVEGDNHMAWMKHAGILKSLLAAVADAEGIEPARTQFALLSEEIASLVKRFGIPEGKLYKAWCPMAFDNRGAMWVQDHEEISNPYFGDMMLRCGEIREVLQ